MVCALKDISALISARTRPQKRCALSLRTGRYFRTGRDLNLLAGGRDHTAGFARARRAVACCLLLNRLGADNGGGRTATGGGPRRRRSLPPLLALRAEAVQVSFEQARELVKAWD
jgi:hypothetical protein